ncbi:MAG: hypothetical protein KGR26_01525, partial [Cyanobacteria bacterium REEB65]|nr:hypothetical protein [Cyanobacteria bacterium REEB65]
SDRAGGLALVKLVYGGLMLGWFAMLLAIFRAAGCSTLLAAWGALATALTAFTQIWPRPQGFTLLGLTATMLVLQRWKLASERGRRSRAVWLLPGIVLPWVNLHGGGAVAGPLSCLVVAAIELMAHSLSSWRGIRLAPTGRSPAPGMGSSKDLAMATALAFIALMINPRGPAILAFAAAPLVDPQVRAMNALIPEWGPFRWDDPTCQHLVYWLVTGLMAAVLAVAIGKTGGSQGSVRPKEGKAPGRLSFLVLAIVWIALGFLSRRHLPLAAVAVSPVLALWLAAAQSAVRRLSEGRAICLTLVAVIVGAFSVGPAVLDRVAFGPLETGLRFPSMQAIAATVRLAPGRRLLNLYDWGGVLLLAGYPQLRDFIDGRQYPFGLALNEAHDRMMGAAPGWRHDLVRYGIDMVVAPPDVPLIRRLERLPSWSIAFADPSAVIMERQTTAGRLSSLPAAAGLRPGRDARGAKPRLFAGEPAWPDRRAWRRRPSP